MTDATVGAISYQFKADIGDIKAKMADMKSGIKDASDNIKSRMGEATRSFLDFGRATDQTTAKIRAHAEVVADAAWNYGPWSGQVVQTAQIIGTALVTSLARANLAMKALGVAVTGTAVAYAAMLGVIVAGRKSIEDISEVGKTIKLVGVDLEKFQALQRAAVQSGGTRQGMADALQGIAKAANDASRDENEFSKVLDANGVKLKDNQGNIRSTLALLMDYADLVKNAKTEQDKLVLLEAIGSDKSMIQFFERGSEAIRQLATEAEKAGGAIDRGMIERAAAFDAKWKEITDNFATWWKSAIMDVLEWFDKLNAIALDAWVKVGLLKEAATGAGVSPFGALDGAGGKMSSSKSYGTDAGARKALSDLMGGAKTTTIPTDKDKGGGASKAAKEAKDAVERYLDSQKKALATAQAEAETWNKSNADRAEAVSLARAQAAAEADGKKLTDQQADAARRYGREIQAIRDKTEQLRELAQGMSDTFASSLDQLIVKGGKLNDVMQNLMQTLMSAALRGALTGDGMFGGMLGGAAGSGGLLGGLTKGMASLFDGFRAEGGGVSGGRAYVVGERGPELFMPSGGGSIIPNGGGGMSVQVHNYAGAQIETRTTRGPNNQQQLLVAVRDQLHSEIANNGSFARALQNTYGLSRATGRG